MQVMTQMDYIIIIGMNQYWNRRRGECDITVVDLDNTKINFKVKMEILPEMILKELRRDDCYLVCSGHVMNPDNIKKHMREYQIFYVLKIRDR